MERNTFLCYYTDKIMSKKTIIIFTLLAIGFLSFTWQIMGKKVSVVSSDKMNVVASFYPLAFLAEEIGGDKVVVRNITPTGAEPHEYEPSPRDLAEMEQSRVLIVNGLGLEPWYENAKKNIDPKKTDILAVGDGLGNTKDPHVWLSPVFMKIMGEKIERAFTKADPKNEKYYTENLQAVQAKLDILNMEYAQGLINCEQKSIVTSHKAFGYLASDYHLVQIPIAGLSPDAEPSSKQLADIATFAKANKIGYIFFESLASPKLSETIATEIKAKTLVLNPIEGLTKEEMLQGKNYLSVMRENLANLQIALSCKK